MWSAVSMVSSSCSTTITVLPRSRSRSRVSIRRRLSRWCRPMEGSSRMYSTPTRLEPIWVASRMRCASPPDSVAGRAVQVEIADAHRVQEREPLPDLLEHPPADQSLALGQLACRTRKRDQLGHRQQAQLVQVESAHRHRQTLRPQPGALAGRARHLRHVLLDLLAHVVGVGLPVAALQVRHDAFEVRHVAALEAPAVGVGDVEALALRAVEEDVLDLLRAATARGCRRPAGTSPPEPG